MLDFFYIYLVLLAPRTLCIDIAKSTEKEVFNKIRYEECFHFDNGFPNPTQ